jgi:hypothetical protein
LTALKDQQLARLLMWVPMGVVCFSVCLMLAAGLVASEEDHPDEGKDGADLGQESGHSRPGSCRSAESHGNPVPRLFGPTPWIITTAGRKLQA